MDWIQVAIEGIDTSGFDINTGLKNSVKMMSLISCIDVLWEGIQQLHRVFFNTKEIPFEDECSIFQDKLLEESDNKYWKTIRACFATHPINIDSFSKNTKEERHYASWSASGVGKGDFSVSIRSNKPDASTIYLSIYYNELMNFVSQRYQHLEDIIKEIDKQKKQYISSFKEKIIIEVDDPLEQIKILTNENKNRFGEDMGYSDELKELKLIFEVHIINENNRILVEKLRKQLFMKIKEIHANLQNMECSELISIPDIPDPAGYGYVYSKLYGYVEGHNDSLFLFQAELLDELRNDLEHLVDFVHWDSYVELYVLSKAGLFHKATH